MEHLTLTQLYSKSHNRLAKIIYFFLYAIVLICIYGLTLGESGPVIDFFVDLFFAIIIFEAIRRAFYYIATGTITPKK